MSHPLGFNCSAVHAVLNGSESLGNERLVLAVIASHINAKTLTAWPSVERIQRLSGIAEAKSVRRIVNRLIGKGELARDVQPRKGSTNVYRLPKLEEWVRATSELRVDISEEAQQGESLFSPDNPSSTNIIDNQRSSGVQETSPHELLVQKLSDLFVDALIAAGHKSALYRADAQSEQWLDGIRRLLFEQPPWSGLGLGDIPAVIEHVALTPVVRGQQIRTPADLARVWTHAHDDYLKAQGRQAEPPYVGAATKLRDQRTSRITADEVLHACLQDLEVRS